MKHLSIAVAVFLALRAFAYEIPIGGDFADVGDDGFPKAWSLFDGGDSKVEVKRGESGNELHFFRTSGKKNPYLRSRMRIRATAGDLVTVGFEARGSGKVGLNLCCRNAKGGFSRTLPLQYFGLGNAWKESSFTFLLMDGATKVESCEVMLYLQAGSDAYIRNVRVSRRLEIVRELAKDDYETPTSRSGNPEIVRGDIAPGLLAQTGKGTYRTGGSVDISSATDLAIPPPGEFLASGVRIYGFGKDNSGSLRTTFAKGESRFTLTVTPKADDIVCLFTGGGRFSVDKTSLPADFVLSVSDEGIYELSISSLANSQTLSYSGKAEILRGMNGGVTRTISLVAAEGKAAEVTVDNVLLAISRPARQAEVPYPYVAKPQLEFDPVKAGWPLVFSDEFDGTEIDRAKWDFSVRGSKSRVQVEDGLLKISAGYAPGSTNKLETSGLWSVPKFLYGYFESRLKFTTYNGWWSAFWLCSHSTGNPFLDGMEIDIFEDYYMRNPERNKLDHNLHVKGGGGVLKSWNYNSTLPGSHDDWYVIGCKWTPLEITYYINGKAIRSKAAHSPYDTVTFDSFRYGTSIMPLHAIVSGQIMKVAYGKHDPDPSEAYPERFEVDYVRVYGYPGETEGISPQVELVAADEIKSFTPSGRTVKFSANAKPSVKTGAKIKAVHLFDNGYYICTSTEVPCDFTVPFTEAFFSRTAWSLPGRSGVRPNFDGSMHVFCAFAEDENGEVGRSGTIQTMISPRGTSRPFRGKAASIPGTIKAGHYDEGGQGVAYNDTTRGNTGDKRWRTEEDVDGGENTIGGLSSGEWLKYTIDVRKAGRYRMKFRYGTPIKGAHWVDLVLDGDWTGKIGPFYAHKSPHFGVDSLAETEVVLPAGRHVLMLVLYGVFNFGNMEFEETIQ